MPFPTLRVALLWLLTVSVPATGVSAGSPDAFTAQAAADFRAGRYVESMAAARQARAAGAGPEALETLAVAALRLGLAPVAWASYEAIIADPAAGAALALRARKQLSALQNQTALVEVESDWSGAEILLGTHSLGNTPLAPIRVFPPTASLTARLPDGRVERADMAIRRGQRHTWRLPSSVAVAPSSVPAPPTAALAPPTPATIPVPSAAEVPDTPPLLVLVYGAEPMLVAQVAEISARTLGCGATTDRCRVQSVDLRDRASRADGADAPLARLAGRDGAEALENRCLGLAATAAGRAGKQEWLCVLLRSDRDPPHAVFVRQAQVVARFPAGPARRGTAPPTYEDWLWTAVAAGSLALVDGTIRFEGPGRALLPVDLGAAIGSTTFRWEPLPTTRGLAPTAAHDITFEYEGCERPVVRRIDFGTARVIEASCHGEAEVAIAVQSDHEGTVEARTTDSKGPPLLRTAPIPIGDRAVLGLDRTRNWLVECRFRSGLTWRRRLDRAELSRPVSLHCERFENTRIQTIRTTHGGTRLRLDGAWIRPFAAALGAPAPGTDEQADTLEPGRTYWFHVRPGLHSLHAFAPGARVSWSAPMTVDDARPPEPLTTSFEDATPADLVGVGPTPRLDATGTSPASAPRWTRLGAVAAGALVLAGGAIWYIGERQNTTATDLEARGSLHPADAEGARVEADRLRYGGIGLTAAAGLALTGFLTAAIVFTDE